MRIFLIAGESSGDIHGANLVRALREADPRVECVGIGGKNMEQAGMKLYVDLAGRAIMGFVEVIKHFGYIRELYGATVRQLEEDRPDCLVVIDYPGFNLQIAKRANMLDIPVVWYISPQVWAWKRGRIPVIARLVQKMLVILPFEKRIYDAVGLDCAYVGHPLLDEIAATPIAGTFQGGTVIVFMPGSREQEINRILPTMIDVGRGIRELYPHARFVAPCVNEDREAQVKALSGDFPIETVIGQTYELLSAARFCLVASGTATVETMLFNVPMIVMYRVAPLTYWLARLLVRVKHIAMVNILAGDRIVPEYVQHEATAERIVPEALELIADGPRRERMLRELNRVREQLGEAGASARAAVHVLDVARARGAA